MGNELPRRLAEARRTSAKLAADFPEIYTVLRTRDEEAEVAIDGESESISINVRTNSRGERCVEVVSDREMTVLEAKGILHDALYALVQTREVAVFKTV